MASPNRRQNAVYRARLTQPPNGRFNSYAKRYHRALAAHRYELQRSRLAGRFTAIPELLWPLGFITRAPLLGVESR
jgi:hypothetical protein